MTPNRIIESYKNGIFPMGEQNNDRVIIWCNPERRAIIPVGKLHISKSLRKDYKKRKLKFTVNKCFREVIFRCSDRSETWITFPIIESFIELNRLGYAHSVEVWDEAELIGGLYGVSIGAAFFAESMFSNSKNGSKFSMMALMFLLVKNNFLILDVQFMTNHLETMGAKEISRSEFQEKLKTAVESTVNFEGTEIDQLYIRLKNSFD